jgi:putative hydrolase of the HAD superfamily
MKIKALLFDMDDTLIPSSKIYDKAMKAAGLGAKKEYWTARAAVKKRLGKTHPSSHNRLLYFKEMDERHALEWIVRYEKALGREVSRAWRALKRPALFNRLAKRYQLAIVTNENTRTQLIKRRAIDPSGKLFTALITSEEVGVEKPHPKIFRETFRRLKRKPGECVMIGDDKAKDITPMKKTGGKGFLVSNCDLRPLERWLDESR